MRLFGAKPVSLVLSHNQLLLETTEGHSVVVLPESLADQQAHSSALFFSDLCFTTPGGKVRIKGVS